MKTSFFTALLCVMCFGCVVFTSCQKDLCVNTVCQHGGTCSDGICKCPTGYEGANCQSTVGSKFTGKYNGEDCDGPNMYELYSVGTTSIGMRVPDVVGAVNGTAAGNAVTFSPQVVYVTTGDKVTISGSATLNGNSINIFITATLSDGTPYNCSFSGSK